MVWRDTKPNHTVLTFDILLHESKMVVPLLVYHNCTWLQELVVGCSDENLIVKQQKCYTKNSI